MISRFDDGCSQCNRGALCIFVRDHPYLSMFVSGVFGCVIGNFLTWSFF